MNDNYANNLGLDIGGTYVEFTRGYVIVDVTIKREGFRFVNTHLEVRSSPESAFRVVQSAQMFELLLKVEFLSGLDPKPVIMVGDFNSSPDDTPGTGTLPDGAQVDYVPPYMQAIAAGYKDAWLEQRRYGDGFTSGFDETVSDPTAELTTRIDHIFLKPMDFAIEKVKCDVVGDEATDMTPGGQWPSDHAGVVAKVKFLAPWALPEIKSTK